MAQLQGTSNKTYCPYKGERVYYSIPAGGQRFRCLHKYSLDNYCLGSNIPFKV